MVPQPGLLSSYCPAFAAGTVAHPQRRRAALGCLQLSARQRGPGRYVAISLPPPAFNHHHHPLPLCPSFVPCTFTFAPSQCQRPSRSHRPGRPCSAQLATWALTSLVIPLIMSQSHVTLTSREATTRLLTIPPRWSPRTPRACPLTLHDKFHADAEPKARSTIHLTPP